MPRREIELKKMETWKKGSFRTEQWFETLVETAPDSIVIVDDKGGIVLANNQTQNMFGYPRKELLGKKIEILIPERFRETHLVDRLEYMKDPRIRPMGIGRDLFGRRKDGSEFPVEISLSPMRAENGLFVSSVIRDVTRRKENENELRLYRQHLEELVRERTMKLREAEKLAEVGRLAATIAHEIKNPLAGIHAACQVLANDVPKEDPRKEVFDNIAKEIRRLDDTIQDLLRFARPIPPNRTPTDLKQFVAGLVEMNRHQPDVSRHSVDVDLPEGFLLDLDQRLMGEVITNLILNAGQAMGERGKIWLRGYRERGYAILEVRDSGPGIPDKIANQIFDPFITTKIRGTGLGLSIAKKNVQAHGGTIELQERSGEGALFRIHLPIANSEGHSSDFEKPTEIP